MYFSLALACGAGLILFYISQAINSHTGKHIMRRVTKVSNSKQVDGVWTTDFGEISLLIARSDSANYNYENALQKYMAPHKKKMERGKSLSNEAAKQVMIKVTAEAVLLGWNEKGHKGDMVLDDDGKPAEYNFDNCVDLLKIDPDLRKFVEEYATDIDHYMDDKEVVGKSLKG